MIIQFNTGNKITGSDEFKTPLIAIIREELSRFSSKITRIEVHLSDEDGPKDGLNDNRCMLEARIEGRQPVAVTHQANNHILAVSGAAEKLKNSLDSIFGRLKNH